ncbi:MAG: UDP-2,3-diacylglucosamine diphosphatase [Gallionellaceae bacterium]
MHTLFISDLHLSAKHPGSAQLFLRFIQNVAPGANALYILGDLFEYWAGDDDLDDPFHTQVAHALNILTSGGTRLFLMHGNRDFLISDKFAAACGATLLPDPVLLDLYGIPTLISHGDMLCTDDIDYQAYRKQVHEPSWQQQFLGLPLAQRKDLIAQLRMRSESAKQRKSSDIMDVNGIAVAELLRSHGYPRLIHGHTHRPGHALHHLDGHTCERWVLGDWDNNANALRGDSNGLSWISKW